MKNILIVLRHDADYRPGGDTVLLTALSKYLFDCNCKITTGLPNDVKGYDFVVCANLDRPVEAYNLLLLCLKDDVPLHLMALHHSYKELSKFLRSGLFGWKRILSVLARFKPVQYEQYLWTLRVIISFFSKGPLLSFGNVSRAQKALLENCELLLVVSQDELKMIQHDIGKVFCRVVEVPHIIEEQSSVEIAKKQIVFCPGRIESRKNQLFLLEVAKCLKEYKFVFMGRLNSSEPSYCAKFMDKLSKLDNVTYLEPREINGFREYLLGSNIVLTASWFEVTSLIEIEVLKNKKKLVTCSPSYNHSFFFNPFTFEFNNLNHCVNVLKKAFDEENFELPGDYPENHQITKSYIDSV